MLSLLIIDSEKNCYAGEAPRQFSTLLNAHLYSEQPNLSHLAIKKMIDEYQLIPFDNNHTEELIRVNTDGIYFIDMQDKVIATTSCYDSVGELRTIQLLNKLTPHIIEPGKEEYFQQIKTMLDANLFEMDRTTEILFSTCVNQFLNQSSELLLALPKFEEHLSKIEKLSFKIKKDTGWTILQTSDDNFSFYNGLFLHLLDKDILFNTTERENLESFLGSHFDEYYDSQIDELFSKIDSKIEKNYLDEKINQAASHIENNKIKL